MRRRIPTTSMRTLAIAATLLVAARAFAPPSSPGTVRSVARPRAPPAFRPKRTPSPPSSRSGSNTALSVLGQEGLFGVGAPEIAVTLIVGYFVLGPSDLYKLVKEVGKFIQNFRTLGTEAAKQFEGTMENQLELTELRKAQAELNDAFSFRRSINTDAEAAFENTNWEENIAASEAAAAGAAGMGAAGAAAAEGAEGAPKKKKRRLVRRKKKKAVEEIDVPPEESILEKPLAETYPDLDMLDVPNLTEEERLRAERKERLTGGGGGGLSDAGRSEGAPGEPDWFTASEEEIANEVLSGQREVKDPALEAFEKQRFQSQLSAEDWNAQIMANEEELAPLSMVMKRLAILEEEKNAADRRLEEEYQKRMDNEDKFYLEKRRVLEEAIVEIQEGVYAGKADAATEEGKEAELTANATKTA